MIEIKLKSKRFIILFIVFMAIIAVAFSGCNSVTQSDVIDKNISVTLLNGENYKVVGKNKQVVEKCGSASFTVNVDRGYEIVGFFGDDCIVSENLGFVQTITFKDIKYKSTVRFETKKLETCEFTINNKENESGKVEVSSVLGRADNGDFYANDILNIKAIAQQGYRFWCWTTGGYVGSGGKFFSYDEELSGFELKENKALYANFLKASALKNTLIYLFGDSRIEQDCTALLEHHPRANTYTAVDLRAKGIDCDSRMLIGYTTVEGDYIGLGSRVAVDTERGTVLYPVWKEYTPTQEFEADGGTITSYNGNREEVIIPRSINGEEITEIAPKAFLGSKASIYYLPDTITTVKEDAFIDCENLKEVYMSDNITEISDSSFTGCKNFNTIHLNAVMKPRWSAAEVSAKTNAYDLLAKNAGNGNKKIAVFGGSSVNFGFSSNIIKSLFAEEGVANLEVYNLGYYANACGYMQFEVFSKYLSKDDIFLHAPEICFSHWGSWSGDLKPSVLSGKNAFVLDSISFTITEGNWQFLSDITINEYSNFFDLFRTFNTDRLSLNEMEYSNFYATVADEQIGYRDANEKAFPENGSNRVLGCQGSLNESDLAPQLILSAVNKIYPILERKGVHTFVTFCPVNRHGLLPFYYNTEEELKNAADNYTKIVRNNLSHANVKLLMTQYDTVYDGMHFVDTDYHIGHPFRDTHTSNIIGALIQSLKEEEIL